MPLNQYVSIEDVLSECPDVVSLQNVSDPRPVEAYQYSYSGHSASYTGRLEAGTIPGEYLLRVKGGASLGIECVIELPDGTRLAELNHRAAHLSRLRRSLTAGVANPRYWVHRLKSLPRRSSGRQLVQGSVAALNGPSSHNYFHWMIEILPRLQTLRAVGVTSDWYLIDVRKPFQRQVLDTLGIPLDRVIQPHRRLFLEADELLVPSYQVLPNGCQNVAKELLDRTEEGLFIGKRRLFINRRGSRTVQNKRQLDQLLRRFDFEERFLEDHDVSEQIRLFRQAEVVLALHGAGLTNSVFCHPEAHVIELMPEGRLQLCYPRLSQVAGLRHSLITAERVGFRQTMAAPIEKLEAVITETWKRRAAPSLRAAA